jgi:hypothetical protein
MILDEYDALTKAKVSPTRIRTEDIAFKVPGDNHFTIGDAPNLDGILTL